MREFAAGMMKAEVRMQNEGTLRSWFRILRFFKGGSSIGRVAVSKTVGWGFESLPPCQPSLAVAARLMTPQTSEPASLELEMR